MTMLMNTPEFLTDEWIRDDSPECGYGDEFATTARMLARQIYESMNIGTEAVSTVTITLDPSRVEEFTGMCAALQNVDDAIKNLCCLIAEKAKDLDAHEINDLARGFHIEQAERGDFAAVPYYPY
jgi:hypothetical protein